MNQKSRTQNAMRNISFSLVCRLVDFIFNFVVRIIFVRLLGEEILGINGLFTNILTWLSLADLGFGTAMSFSFYKPLAEQDEKKLAALTHFYRKVYTTIMISVLIIGLSLVPFLNLFIKMDNPIPHLTAYYIILLLNTTFSYLFVYKSSILRADQNEYMISMCSTIFNILKAITQIIVLLFYRDYRLFLIIQVIFTILNNLFVSHVADKKYPFLSKRVDLNKKEKKSIYQNVSAVLLYKISATLLNGTDNVLISMIVGTVYVGYYSNYLFAINSITGFISIIFSSIYGSLGNLLHDRNARKNETVFNSLVYFGYFIGCVTSACFIAVFNDYIRIFFGSQYLLSSATVLAIVGNFYLSCICQPIWTFRETAGVFKKVKYVMVCTAFINLILSIILGYIWGVFGIIFASAIARLVTYFWYEPVLLYRDIFKNDVHFYFQKIFKYFVITLISLIPAFIMMTMCRDNMMLLVIKLVISGLGSLILFVLLTRKDTSLKNIKNIIFQKIFHP